MTTIKVTYDADRLFCATVTTEGVHTYRCAYLTAVATLTERVPDALAASALNALMDGTIKSITVEV